MLSAAINDCIRETENISVFTTSPALIYTFPVSFASRFSGRSSNKEKNHYNMEILVLFCSPLIFRRKIYIFIILPPCSVFKLETTFPGIIGMLRNMETPGERR